MMWSSIVCALLCLPVAVLAQAPPSKSLPKSSPKSSPDGPSKQDASKSIAIEPITSEQRDQAIKLLRRHAELSKSVRVLVADYVQRRTTTLSKKPLRSSGGFLFVHTPACVVFRAEKPRQSIVRLTKDLYEVFRPRRKRLERFTLDGPDLSQGLFAAVGGDADSLLEEFGVAGLSVGKVQAEGGQIAVEDPVEISATGAPMTAAIRLVPKSKAMGERLQELVVTFVVIASSKPADTEPADTKLQAKPGVTLRSVAYRDHSGDLVEIALRNVRTNPKDAPSVAFEVPKDTKVIEHRAGR